MHADQHVLRAYYTAEQFESAAETAGVDLQIDRFDARLAHLLDEAGPGWSISIARGEVINEEDSLFDAVARNVREQRLALQRLERWIKKRQ